MRVYNRKDFLKLPNGIIFCKGVKWCFDTMKIKCQSLNHCEYDDFVYMDLCNIDSEDTGSWVDKLEDSLLNGTSYPININTEGDGLFEKDSIFLVFEKEDLQYLSDIIKECIPLQD